MVSSTCSACSSETLGREPAGFQTLDCVCPCACVQARDGSGLARYAVRDVVSREVVDACHHVNAGVLAFHRADEHQRSEFLASFTTPEFDDFCQQARIWAKLYVFTSASAPTASRCCAFCCGASSHYCGALYWFTREDRFISVHDIVDVLESRLDYALPRAQRVATRWTFEPVPHAVLRQWAIIIPGLEEV